MHQTSLRPFTDEEYQNFIQPSIENYAAEKTRAGNFRPETALQQAKEEFNHLLPAGMTTPNHYFYAIVDKETNQKVGHLWFTREEREEPIIYIYDVKIDEPYRRHGYAQGAFNRLEEKARELHVKKISLHVFGHNHAARALYEKLGYAATNINMSKTIDD
jgi:RimJ/RimL family protein N-acetyltransferase